MLVTFLIRLSLSKIGKTIATFFTEKFGDFTEK